MAKVLVTGSSDGIGLQTARVLADAGHRVVLHARDESRAASIASTVPHAAGTVLGDLASIEQTRTMAKAATALGPFDTVIHNAGVSGMVTRDVTADGFSRMFQVNVMAPYLLTALIPLPRRLVYLSSGLEARGIADLDDVQYERKPWNGMQAYSDAKLYDVMLAFAMARRYPQVISNAVDPGWVRTKLGGPNAPGSPLDGADTPVWLATSDEPAATVSGRFLKNRTVLPANPAASTTALQDRLLEILQDCTKADLPQV